MPKRKRKSDSREEAGEAKEHRDIGQMKRMMKGMSKRKMAKRY